MGIRPNAPEKRKLIAVKLSLKFLLNKNILIKKISSYKIP
jgi:hypothetical protein